MGNLDFKKFLYINECIRFIKSIIYFCRQVEQESSVNQGLDWNTTIFQHSEFIMNSFMYGCRYDRKVKDVVTQPVYTGQSQPSRLLVQVSMYVSFSIINEKSLLVSTVVYLPDRDPIIIRDPYSNNHGTWTRWNCPLC